jgi:LCP family protein required for cell wall assembly
MTDEFEALRATRATVAAPSAAARDAAHTRWSTEPSELSAEPDRGGHAFAQRTLVAALLVTALVAGGWFVTRNRVQSVKPLHIVTVTSLVPATATEPQVFLLVGSDSRAFVDDEADKQEFGDPATISGERSDTMIVVRVDPATGQVLVVSIPRDLFVDIPGCGRQRINAAFDADLPCSAATGGTGLLVQTITRALGIPINHVIELQFPQFAALAGELGGLRINFPAPARDSETGLNESAGCTTLDGAQALAFVRSRHLEWQVNGGWVEDPTADLGRIAREQLAVRQLAVAAEARMGTDPRPILNELFAHVTVDAGFTADDALRYFAALRNDQKTTTATLPTKPEIIDGIDGLTLDPAAQPILDALAGHGTIGAPASGSGGTGPEAGAC